MPAKSSGGRRKSAARSPMASMVIAALSLLILIAIVGIGCSMLGGKDKVPSSGVASSALNGNIPTVSSDVMLPDFGDFSSTTPAVMSMSTGASGSTASGTASSTVSGTASGAPSTSTAAAPAGLSNVPAAFDAANMGSSGYANIPNYQKINADVKGWLRVPGTNINYPVLWSNDVYYYLARDLYKQKSKDGVVYADPAVRFGTSQQISRNTILYGHNWTNVSANPRVGTASDVMFAQLTSYHHLKFAQAYPYIYYSTEAEEMTWQVFAAFYTDIGFAYNYANPDDATFANIIAGAKSRSRHVFDTAVSSSDKILTLSTCTRAYGSSDRQRFVVMARLMNVQDDMTAVKVTANPNPVLPSL